MGARETFLNTFIKNTQMKENDIFAFSGAILFLICSILILLASYASAENTATTLPHYTDFLTAGCFTHEYPSMSASARSQCLNNIASRGYTHFYVYVYNENDYGGPAFNYYNNPSGFVSILNEIRGAGLRPVVWLTSDDSPIMKQRSVTEIKAMYDKLIPVIDSRVDSYVLGLELDEYWSASKVNSLGTYLDSLTSKTIAVHQLKGNYNFCNYNWCDYMVFQYGMDKTESQIISMTHDAINSLGKPVVAGEYNVNGGESRSIRLGNAGVSAGASGFGNGGTVSCTPECSGRECGSDRCGGQCGDCAGDESCVNYQCVPDCLPSCSGKECGSDGCGGSCGSCEGKLCSEGQCIVSDYSYFWFEAEDGAVSAPFVVGSDNDASGGEFVWAPEGVGANGYADYSISVSTASDYIVWSRALASDGTSDSFLVSVDSGSDNLWDVGLSSQWKWDSVSDRGTGTFDRPESDPVLFNLDAGSHVLRVAAREDGAKIDKLLVTNDLLYVPSGFGDVTSDPCGDGSCGVDEDCSSCPSDCACSGLCCSGSCVNKCKFDSDCSDDDACTVDSCTAPDTCSAYCSKTPITQCVGGDGCCPASCDIRSDSDCKNLCSYVLYMNSFDVAPSGMGTVDGVHSGAISLDGVDDYISLSSGSKDAAPFSVSFWFKTTKNTGTMFSYREEPTDMDYLVVRVIDGKANFRYLTYDSPNIGAVTSSNKVADGSWHHLVAVRDGDRTAKLYVDVVLVGEDTDKSGSSAKIDSPHVVSIGRNEYLESDYFEGLLDDFATWDKALTQDEITLLHESNVCSFHPADSDSDGCVELSELIAYLNRWKVMNDDVSLLEVVDAIRVWKDGC